MKIRIGLFFLMALSVDVSAASPSKGLPNILLIVAEDMSSRVGAFGDLAANTPALDKLARQGVRYTNVFTAAGVCAPSRSALITGVYPQSMGTQHMRTAYYQYEAVPPAEIKAFPELLRRAGYVTANFAKRDYQFGEPFTVWDVDVGGFTSELEPAVWRQLPQGKPFFAMINLMWTHESRLFDVADEAKGRFGAKIKKLAQTREQLINHVTNPADVTVPPYYPDTPRVRKNIAQMYDNIHYMDSQVAAILSNLQKDGLADNTIIIWTTDHGDGFPRAKRSVYDSGLHVPMIVRFPDGHGEGNVEHQLVSFVDLAPTILDLAGASIPEFIQGRNFLDNRQINSRQYIYAGRDRMDGTPDWVRAVRDQRYKYIRNYMDGLAYFRPLAFRDMFPIMQELWAGEAENLLNNTQHFYFKAPRPKEELYDTLTDPYEVHNLAADPDFAGELQRLRAAMDQWLARVGDTSREPEANMIAEMWPGGKQPVTAKPKADVIASSASNQAALNTALSVTLASDTSGASIGYRLISKGEDTPWQLYTGPVTVPSNKTLQAKAIRYGYAESDLLIFPGKP